MGKEGPIGVGSVKIDALLRDIFPHTLILSSDGREQHLPKVRGAEREMMGVRRVGPLGASLSGLRVRQQDGAFAKREEPRS
jgi:hypothetical protein